MLPKRILPLLVAGVLAANAQTPPSGSPIDPKVKALIDEARVLQQKQRSYEALTKLDEADAISPGSAFVANVRGSIYTAPPLRDYAKARECFEAAEKLMPAAFEPKFNKTELLYVERKYAEAEAEFARLLEAFPKLREEVRHLIQFKIIICQLKLGKAEDAGKVAQAFTFMDDTPAYYFTKASYAFQAADTEQARQWVAKATKIFKPQETAVYLDTLMEAGWLHSITSGNGVQ